MSDWSDIAKLAVVTVFGTPLILAFLAYLSKEGVKSFLLVGAQNSINQYKQLLDTQTESIKSYLLVGAQNSINEHKQVLDTYTESMKHSLQREMVRVESYVKGKFTVYPTLYEKILKAQGAISGIFGLRFSTNQDRFTEEDVKSQLEENRVVEGEAQHILGAFRDDRKKGLKLFNKMMREIEFQKAQNLYQEAKNYFVLNELFMSKEAADLAYGIFTSLWSVWVDSHLSHQSEGDYNNIREVREGNKKNDAMIAKLKDLMRREMEPEPPG